AVKVQRTAADDFALVLHHDEVADVLADVPQRTRQQCSVADVDLNQLLDGNGIGKFGVTRTHGQLLSTWIIFLWPRAGIGARAQELCLLRHHEWPVRWPRSALHRTAHRP